MEYKLHNGSGGLCCKGCSRQDKKLNTYDWLADIPGNAEESDMVEVQFKNTRKGYYRNSNKIKLEKGDIVAVEAAPGHDIGVVTLTGRLVPLQMKKANFKADAEIKRIYRKAKPVDMEKFNEAKDKEHATMIRARQIALNLNLNMKIGDVEYQGDGNKAIFYYIADERVDFRQLIKVLAEAFRVRIEMKQIGARQEAGRIGGIGPCGRELCCATWMTSFVSVSTSAARFQDISLNPQKLAGQCAKLKCCLNYEVDCYVEAQKRLPSKEIELETKDGTFYFFKADILSNQVSYSTDKNFPANLVTISGKRAFEVIGMNKKGMKPDSLLEEERKAEPKKPIDLLEQESVTRFDRSRALLHPSQPLARRAQQHHRLRYCRGACRLLHYENSARAKRRAQLRVMLRLCQQQNTGAAAGRDILRKSAAELIRERCVDNDKIKAFLYRRASRLRAALYLFHRKAVSVKQRDHTAVEFFRR